MLVVKAVPGINWKSFLKVRNSQKIYILNYSGVGRDSAVGIVARYGLDGPWIESRWGARFSARVQNGPGAHTASYNMGTESFSGGKAAGAWR